MQAEYARLIAKRYRTLRQTGRDNHPLYDLWIDIYPRIWMGVRSGVNHVILPTCPPQAILEVLRSEGFGIYHHAAEPGKVTIVWAEARPGIKTMVERANKAWEAHRAGEAQRLIENRGPCPKVPPPIPRIPLKLSASLPPFTPLRALGADAAPDVPDVPSDIPVSNL